ncbi:hypothetical protein ASQ66_gp01 [Aeropyrum pernix spindle-shaped virus 1]|uniref:Uncharacterized protein n=1 Tax=Aeropyrum pernix (strain ATCC 700893 / DSM 11879 / JCM 9820 / NBRC 100138 / K1) TaxID=272557 RepID=Q05E49_AERPE|nr:hypothetical protein [Aeropyrum pernix]YP_009177731.1 hypothetical protein ASQ66_gp01 [Aeropyrum pernix spindle-shaped virus 1]BAF34752.1 hypothetical protein APE_0818a [Aeropyrum pernix spindle-shaped virus 1] [Aeropyrum pernix K1]CCD22089.1 TPA: hypothetical protein [Aeropyrum pernix spindle-shaped virus 1]
MRVENASLGDRLSRLSGKMIRRVRLSWCNNEEHRTVDIFEDLMHMFLCDGYHVAIILEDGTVVELFADDNGHINIYEKRGKVG